MTTNNSIDSNFPATPALPVNGGTGVSSPTAHTLPIAEGASNFAFLGPLTNGQLLIGSTGADPVAASLTAGAGITLTPGAGSLMITASGAGEPWTTVTGTSQALAVNNGYYANNAGLVTLTLPATAAVGDLIFVGGQGAGGWSIAQNAGQSIVFGTATTTVGAGGSLSSSSQYNNVTLRCMVANTTFAVWGVQGNPNVV